MTNHATKSSSFDDHLRNRLEDIRKQGTLKSERVITGPSGTRMDVGERKNILNLCANNYLGLAQAPEVIEASKRAIDEWGYGMASVRFICGTQSVHRDLEKALSEFLGTEDTILYSSCFDANGGLFETLLDREDAIISDSLNHASIIDGIRLSKAQRYRYANNDMEDLETKLIEAKSARFRMIATDGVFSMDGTIANLQGICDLADKHDAIVMVDDCHSTGVLGKTGRGTHEHTGVWDRVDLLTGTLGKALGGASGGYISGRKAIIDILRQHSRPYLFSNALAPGIAGASIEVLRLLSGSTRWRDRLEFNTKFFRREIEKIGLTVMPGEHPITPIFLGDAALATRFADAMLDKGVYVIGFSYPVVPKGKARIRTQISAAHTESDLAFAVEAFASVKKELGSV